MAKYDYIDIDDMTVEVWRKMTVEERGEWKHHWRRQGMISFSCLKCGFPTTSGQYGCEACRPIKEE